MPWALAVLHLLLIFSSLLLPHIPLGSPPLASPLLSPTPLCLYFLLWSHQAPRLYTPLLPSQGPHLYLQARPLPRPSHLRISSMTHPNTSSGFSPPKAVFQHHTPSTALGPHLRKQRHGPPSRWVQQLGGIHHPYLPTVHLHPNCQTQQPLPVHCHCQLHCL